MAFWFASHFYFHKVLKIMFFMEIMVFLAESSVDKRCFFCFHLARPILRNYMTQFNQIHYRLWQKYSCLLTNLRNSLNPFHFSIIRDKCLCNYLFRKGNEHLCLFWIVKKLIFLMKREKHSGILLQQ